MRNYYPWDWKWSGASHILFKNSSKNSLICENAPGYGVSENSEHCSNVKTNERGLHGYLQDFVTGLSVSLYGSREEKVKWAFQLYDLDGDGCITREVWSIDSWYCLVRFLTFHPFVSDQVLYPKDVYGKTSLAFAVSIHLWNRLKQIITETLGVRRCFGIGAGEEREADSSDWCKSSLNPNAGFGQPRRIPYFTGRTVDIHAFYEGFSRIPKEFSWGRGSD